MYGHLALLNGKKVGRSMKSESKQHLISLIDELHVDELFPGFGNNEPCLELAHFLHFSKPLNKLQEECKSLEEERRELYITLSEHLTLFVLSHLMLCKLFDGLMRG